MVLASLVAAAAAAVRARSTQVRVRLLPGDPPPTDDTLPTGTATTQQTIAFNGQVADLLPARLFTEAEHQSQREHILREL